MHQICYDCASGPETPPSVQARAIGAACYPSLADRQRAGLALMLYGLREAAQGDSLTDYLRDGLTTHRPSQRLPQTRRLRFLALLRTGVPRDEIPKLLNLHPPKLRRRRTDKNRR